MVNYGEVRRAQLAHLHADAYGVFSDLLRSVQKLHNVELHALYSSPSIIRVLNRDRRAGHVALIEQSINAYRVLVGKSEGKRPLGRPRHRWEDNIKVDLREVGCDPGEWIDLAQDRDQWRAYVKAVVNHQVP